MVTTCYRASLSSNMSKIKAETKSILEFIRGEIPTLSEEDLFDLRLIYSELIVNAIVHGNKYNAKKKVHLAIEINDSQIYSVIRDEGNGFDYLSLVMQDRRGHNNPLNEEGRGLKLVFYIADYVGFNKQGNEITFIKRLNAS